jgi:hypothetical protein
MMLTLVGASDSTIGSNSQVDDQVQPQPQSEAENGEMKGEEEEEKKAATG